jgi:hypothetical protein
LFKISLIMTELERQLLDKVNQLTAKMNLWEQNAKSTEEFPSMSTLVPTASIRVSDAGISKKVTIQQLIDASTYTAQNQIISVGEITVVSNDVTVPACVGLINGVTYQTTTDTVINVPFAASGKNRIDILVLNTSSQIVKVSGFETTGIAVRPNIPINSVLVTQINVTDSEITYVPNLLFYDELSQAEFDALGDATFQAGTYVIVNNAGTRTTYWYSTVLGGWFTNSGGGGSTPNLQAVLGVGDRQTVATDYPITETEWTLGSPDRALFLSLTNATLSNDLTVIVGIAGGTPIEGMEYKVFNGSDHTVTLAPDTGITLLADELVIPKNHVAILKFIQVGGFPPLNENAFSVTYQSNGLGGGGYTDATFGAFINSLTAKNTPIDADIVNYTDSADSNKQKKTTWLNAWTNYIKVKADAVYTTASAVATQISTALSGYATESWVGSAISTALASYSTTSQMNSALDLKADASLFLIQQSDRTLTSNTSAQDIFDVGISSSGALNLLANSTYHFEMELSMTGLSSTSGTISLSFDAGTANITGFRANVIASKAVLNNNSTSQHTFLESTAANPIVNASTVTTAKVFVSGLLTCTTAGTFKPRVTMSQASASTVKALTHLKMERLGTNTTTHYPTS